MVKIREGDAMKTASTTEKRGETLWKQLSQYNNERRAPTGPAHKSKYGERERERDDPNY